MNYGLPTSVLINNTEYEIQSDYRAILGIIEAVSDANLSNTEKVLTVLAIFYPDFEKISVDNYGEALKQCFTFINLGEEEKNNTKRHRLMDWEQDFQYIVAPVNRVIGAEIRAMPYLHWWTFLSAYYEIGDCTFAQIVRIRQLKAKGKPLDKFDREWYREHSDIVDLKNRYTQEEQALMKQWGV